MFSILYHTLQVPVLVGTVILFFLYFVERFFFLSSRRRAQKLFSGTLWLPLRFSNSTLDGEEVEFPSTGRVVLRGTFVKQAARAKGTVLFCHELNGTQRNISPYVNELTESGFNILTFDFRNHGKSDFTKNLQSTPWMTESDLDDVSAAIDYLGSRSDVEPDNISVFGLGKGATVALCAAGKHPKVKSVVLDAPIQENRLFEKNCRDAFLKLKRRTRQRTKHFVSLFFLASIYSLTCPSVAAIHSWKRFILGQWFGCRFINPLPLVRKVRQPIMIVHGHADSLIRADQIQAFCNRMPVRPKLWLTSTSNREGFGGISKDCSLQVARFFEETAAS